LKHAKSDSDPKRDCLPWTKLRRLSHCALKLDVGMWGCGVRAVGLQKKKIYRSRHLYKPIYIYTKNAQLCYISLMRGGAVSQLIGIIFGTLMELTYVINFAKFGVDQSQGWGLVSSQIL